MDAVAVADTLEMTADDYELIRRLVYTHSGINLGDKKAQLVRARLGKIVRAHGLRSFREYYRRVEQDTSGQELCGLLDAISTNTTHLFRERRHFHLLHKLLQDWLADRTWRARHSEIRIWSAACSSGEEAHSIAMVAHDVLLHYSGVGLKILATDLSTQVLARARLGLYDLHRVGTVPPNLRQRYLQPVLTEAGPALQLVPHLRQAITFARLNLMSPVFPFRKQFDVIFCRNVMIYFDRTTQQTLVAKLAGQLADGGYLLIGHSETLSGITHQLTYLEPTVYRKWVQA